MGRLFRCSLFLSSAAVLLVCTASRRAVAQGATNALGDGMKEMALLAAPLLLIPSSVGPELALKKREPSDIRFILGWPFQIPLPFGKEPTMMHRIALAPEVALGARNHAVFRARLGYRFGYRWFFAGAGFLFDKSAVFVSPELGVRYPPGDPDGDIVPGGALYLRSDVEPRDGIVRLSAQIGWVVL